MFTSAKLNNLEKSELLKNENANEELENPGCCLIFCICPWRPHKVYTYLLRKRNKEPKKKVALSQRKDYKTLNNNEENFGADQQAFKQKYNDVFRRKLLLASNSQDSINKKTFSDPIVNKQTEFDSPNQTNNLNDISVSVSVENTEFTFDSRVSFFDNMSSMYMAPRRELNKSPIYEIRSSSSYWIKFSLDFNNFILCVCPSPNSYLVLASLDGVNLKLYSAEDILNSNSSSKCYIWMLDNRTVFQEAAQKTFLRCSTSETTLYFARESNFQLVLSSMLERAIDWEVR